MSLEEAIDNLASLMSATATYVKAHTEALRENTKALQILTPLLERLPVGQPVEDIAYTVQRIAVQTAAPPEEPTAEDLARRAAFEATADMAAAQMAVAAQIAAAAQRAATIREERAGPPTKTSAVHNPLPTAEEALTPKAFTTDEVRAALKELAVRLGKDTAKGVLTRLGYQSISELPEEQYARAIELAKEAK